MPNINTAIRYLQDAVVDSETVVNLSDEFRSRDNASFFARVATELKKKAEKPGPAGTQFDPGGIAAIGLSGEFGLIGYTIRRAQELIRVDHTPSNWSHAFLFASALSEDAATMRSQLNSPWIWESSLEPSPVFNRFADLNGVSPRRLADFRHSKFRFFAAHNVPNVAVIAIALTPEEREKVLHRAADPDVDQLHYDIQALRGAWFVHLSDRASHRNPLIDGIPVFSSAYVQLAYGAVGIDLAPGAHQRNTAPEHIWQAVKYLSQSFQVPDPKTGALEPRPVAAWYCLRDETGMMWPARVSPPRNLRTLLDEFQKAGNS
jgi:hypothetical protein